VYVLKVTRVNIYCVNCTRLSLLKFIPCTFPQHTARCWCPNYVARAESFFRS